MDFSEWMGRVEQDVAFIGKGTFQRIGELLVDSYKMNLTRTIPDGEMQIHMIIRGGFRINGSTVTKEGWVVRVGISER